MSYSRLIHKLYSVGMTNGMKLGLSNSQRLNAALNFPDQSYEVIHVAGTNGKGSTTKKIAAALQHNGHRVGLYTSPHISCFRERIRINGEMISEADVERYLTKIFSIVEQEQIPATFFELTTALALYYFAKNRVDVAVIETGLGGRLDATNIVTPTLSVITSISLDHTDLLGNSIEAIACEKAGIIKPRIPIVLGPRLPLQLFKTIAHARCSPCIPVTGTFDDFEAENCAIARTALETLGVPEKAIQAGLEARLPCRLEEITFPQSSANVILDVAHNPDGLLHLFSALKRRYPAHRIRAVCGLSQNKDLASCLAVLRQYCVHLHLVEATNGRAASARELHAILKAQGTPDSQLTINSNIAEAINQAVAHAGKHPQEIVVICGTFFIMSAARAALGITEPCDPIDLNEKLVQVNKNHVQ